MNFNELPSLSRLRQLLVLDEERWVLFWKERPRSDFKTAHDRSAWNARFAGKPAGYKDRLGYTIVCLDYKKVRAHRIIYAMHNGQICAADQIDHIDNNTANNHPSNLRLATHAENVRNRKCRKDSQSGFKGVRRQKRSFYAEIRVDGVLHYLGSFSTPEAAHAAYANAAHASFGQFARTA